MAAAKRGSIATAQQAQRLGPTEEAHSLLERLGLHNDEALRRRLTRRADGTPCTPSGDGVELAGVVATNGQALQLQLERELMAAILASKDPDSLGAALAAEFSVLLTNVKGAKARAQSTVNDGGQAEQPRSLLDMVRGVVSAESGWGKKADVFFDGLERERRRQIGQWKLVVLAEQEDLLSRSRTVVERVVRRRGELRQVAAGAASTARAEAEQSLLRLAGLGDGLPSGFLLRMVSVLAQEPEEQARQLGLEAVAEVIAADEERAPDLTSQIIATQRRQSELDLVLEDDLPTLIGRLRTAAGRSPQRGMQVLVERLAGAALAEAPHQPLDQGGTRASFQVLAGGTRPLLAVDNGNLGIAWLHGGRRARIGLLHIQGDRSLDDFEIMAPARSALTAAERTANHRLLRAAPADLIDDDLRRYAEQALSETTNPDSLTDDE